MSSLCPEKAQKSSRYKEQVQLSAAVAWAVQPLVLSYKLSLPWHMAGWAESRQSLGGMGRAEGGVFRHAQGHMSCWADRLLIASL